MNFNVKFALILIFLGLLAIGDIAIRINQRRNALMMKSLTKDFIFTPLQTNGLSGIMVSDRSDGQPIFGKWNLSAGGSLSCFHKGRNVINFTYTTNGRSETEVIFYGPDGKISAKWRARGDAGFCERTIIGERSSKTEVQLADKWHEVETRTNGGKAEAGIVLNGQWRHLIYSNGVLVIE